MNKIIHNNCIDEMKTMPPLSVTHTVTDIPYDVVSRDSNGIRKFDKEQADILDFSLDDFVKELTRITQQHIMIFCASEQVSDLVSKLTKQGFESDLAIWQKSNPSPVNGQYIWLSGVECCVVASRDKLPDHLKNVIWKSPSGRSKNHPTEKPLKLMQTIIKEHTNENDIVFDPCAGSGSTLEAAALEKRQWLGIELFEQYYSYIQKRMEKYGS